MTSPDAVEAMDHSSAVAVVSEERGYEQLDDESPIEPKTYRLAVCAGITAVTLLLTTIVSLPAYLLMCSASSSDSTPALPFDAQFVQPTLSNSSQYGDYPMLYEDPNNQWTPSAGFLFNMSSVDIDLNKVSLSAYRGNITLVTNVASF